MAEQRTFAGLAWSSKGKVTRREQFLAEMNGVVPWGRLLKLLEPYYPKAGGGRPPLGLEEMLRAYFVQQWFNLSDPQTEDAIYDSESIRRFVGVELGEDVVPDETTILRFRHLLEAHGLREAIFEEVRALLEERRLLLKAGTIVDATIISAPSSTKNATARRRARSVRRPGVLERGAAPTVSADVRYRVQRRAHRNVPLSERWRKINPSRSRVRARVEHPLLVVKGLWGQTKVRYRGLAKNTAQAWTLFALANLYLVRRRLLPPGAKCLL